LKIVVDMNLSPNWVGILRDHGWDAVHWIDIGDAHAADAIIMRWAAENGYVVFTHDLDFGALLAPSSSSGPSVFQVRSHNIIPQHLANTVIKEMQRHQSALEGGAIVTVDESRSRVRILPTVP
jgi:predicted nuclease of predicted toxin-antitoxin system